MPGGPLHWFMKRDVISRYFSRPTMPEIPAAPLRLASAEDEQSTMSVDSSTLPRPRTQTRRHINALIQQDWKDINDRLTKTLAEVQEIVEAKNDIEVLALISGIDLT